ncbi:hypothetical protein ACXET9_13140 [Brachybacterium sp. DNPG3]
MLTTSPGSWPGSSATVAHWARALLRAGGADGSGGAGQEARVRGLEDVRVDAEVVGSDLQLLDLDATGARLRLEVRPPAAGDRPSDHLDEPSPTVVRSVEGMLRRLRVHAAPVLVDTAEVTLDVRVDELPIRWLTYAEPVDPAVPESICAIEPDEATEAAEAADGALVDAQAAVPVAHLGPLLRAILIPPAEASGLRVTRLEVDVDPDLRVRVRMRSGYRLLRASARAEARVEVSADGRIALHEVRLRSANPLVALTLLIARRPLRSLMATRVDLNEMLARQGAPLRVHDLRLTADDGILRASARASAPGGPSAL